MSDAVGRPTRRSVLTAAGAAGLLLATAGVAEAHTRPGGALPAGADPRSATGTRAGRVRLTLPRPAGPRHIGTLSLHLTDHARQDPWTSHPSPRELMITLWYPARRTQGFRRAPWLPPAAAAQFREQISKDLRTPMDNVDFPLTHGHEGAPVRPHPGGHPLILFSPGYGALRGLSTALAEDLAGRGYAVVTIDHTYDSQIVEFPGGRLELGRQPARPTAADIRKALRVRKDDTGFVLDQLTALNAGRAANAAHTASGSGAGRGQLPQGLRGSLDLSRIAMFGHSLGGDTAAEVMSRDSRVLAGVNLDGSFNGAVATTGLDRPFLLMSNANHGRHNDPSWKRFWSHLRGWHLELRLRDSGHQTYTDLSPLAQQLERALTLPPDVVAQLTTAIGTIDADRAVAAERAYLGAFFDLHLRGHDSRLLSAPSPRYPDISFVP
ncbi:hypothetical protein OG413_37245 [Streptomyces sp. NBC_01433]|uniref:alpha/beta hydrolase family protein n=1 Tax=Streptomyces sp. NBC_01433 TaxID=2903864 RepID=UPI002253A3CB|nr:hypothetical protein [Streptomyces sp. NBC_01433]MCX4680859.1 hypothetical protein [Streptomyces sp. NBC_01433]